MGQPRVSWQMEGDGAHLRCGPLAALVGAGPDGLDLIIEAWNRQAVPGIAVLCSSGPDQSGGPLDIAERYIRGNDFIASCNAMGPHRIRPHLYWRASFDEHRSAARVELVLSAQTELLDSVPTWTVSSYVLGSKLFYARDLSDPHFEDISNAAKKVEVGDCCGHLFVFRIEESALSYAQMVHPSDFVSAASLFDGNQPLVIESKLFPEHLEKGVIRRGRICGWFMPVENDLETAVALARQFVDEPLPLTA
jgi:hypothetical protein